MACNDPIPCSNYELHEQAFETIYSEPGTVRSNLIYFPGSLGRSLLALFALTEILRHERHLEHLRDIAVDIPAIEPAVERLARRMDALAARGEDVDGLDFEASYGRTSMEYYDGFVFGFYVDNRTDLPPVATGGRYDALTRVLGKGNAIPAVGGVIRPGLLLELGRGEA